MADIAKRWRAWLRAIHRDVGYLSIGFTLIYAISGIAQNHILEWGDVSFTFTQRSVTLPVAIDATTPDGVAIGRVVDAVKLGVPKETFRAGDEIRLTYQNGEKATAIGAHVTVQDRSRRAFIGVANWLHTARGKPAWRFVSDVYAVLLVYLAISGLFMIKGRLGLKWRGAILVGAGIAVPVLYVVLSGGPQPSRPDATVATTPVAPAGSAGPSMAGTAGDALGSAVGAVAPGSAAIGTTAGSAVGSGVTAGGGSAAGSADTGGAVLTPLPPDDDE